MADESVWLFTDEEVQQTASVRNGISWPEEKVLRWKCVAHIYQLAGLFRIPGLCAARAAIILHRALMAQSLTQFPIALITEGRNSELPKDVFRLNKLGAEDEFLCACMVCERVFAASVMFEFEIMPPQTLFAFLYTKDIEGRKGIMYRCWRTCNTSMALTMCLNYGPRLHAAAILKITLDHHSDYKAMVIPGDLTEAQFFERFFIPDDGADTDEAIQACLASQIREDVSHSTPLAVVTAVAQRIRAQIDQYSSISKGSEHFVTGY
ncbi:uncharacterized protein MONBRDRAFT_27856 [Monosiga brevicollis MX1]|uniref:Uncharacterized protein n=1 Tax=Monosiga brevicollis TaxID=81824 RepID=A9V6N7_MONBE|nr:uncharacterized protein MONBRDRAFT_27856 [Monosiga brevicollis MX1]EDQ86767.1 predicted protein [Monosiga brevicollis MX1]|eukprot:XP_001748312.1 hypothetical protein [Monosiga brevicollis MX1]